MGNISSNDISEMGESRPITINIPPKVDVQLSANVEIVTEPVTNQPTIKAITAPTSSPTPATSIFEEKGDIHEMIEESKLNWDNTKTFTTDVKTKPKSGYDSDEDYYSSDSFDYDSYDD